MFVPYYRFWAGRISGDAAASTRLYSQTKRVDVMKFLDTSLLAPLWDACVCSPDPPRPSPSNQCRWRRSADVIIINMWRQASEDWWKARSNQCWMPDKCLRWRLPPRCHRWSGFPLHYASKHNTRTGDDDEEEVSRGLPALDIISENVSCCSPRIEGPQRQTMIIW